MEILEKLLADLKGVDARLDALLTHDELTEEQRAQHDSLVNDRDRLAKAIAKEKDRLAREEERQRLEEEAEDAKARADEQARKRAAAEEKRKRAEVAGLGRMTDKDLPITRDLPATSPSARFTVPATVVRVATKHIVGTRDGISAHERAYRFGMWGMGVLSRQIPGRFSHLSFAQDWVKRHMAVGPTDASGYYNLIPEELSSDIIDLREMWGVARKVLRVWTMRSETKKIPRRQSGLTAYPIGPNQAITQSNKTWDNVELVAREWGITSVASRDVGEDLAISWGDDLAYEIAYGFSEKEDDCMANGDGTSTYHGIRGVRTKLQNVDGAGGDSYGLITASGNAYSEITLADFDKVVGRLPVYADTPDTWWMMSKVFFYEVVNKLVEAAGGTTPTEIREGERRPVPIFKGYPVMICQKFPKTEANSQVVATLGDYTLGGAFGDRRREEIEFSTEATVDGQSLWERHQIGIKGTERFDIVIHDVGSTTEAGPIVGLQTAAS